MEPKTTVFRGHEIAPEDLSAHGRAMRAIARSMLGDAHAAEDVVQETWLACLRRPTELPTRVSAWLGTVTRRMALRRTRAEGRRAGREERAARPERVEAVQQRSLEREESMRAVTAAVLGLDEPYKTALLLRYYEDRTPAEIADELGVPLATVKSRLKRGLETLRRRMTAELGGEERSRRLLGVLAGLPTVPSPLPGPTGTEPAAATGLAIGAAMMSVKLQAILMTAAAAAGALLWMSREGEQPERRQESVLVAAPVAGDAPASLPAPSASVAATVDGSRREEVGVEETEPAPAGATYPEEQSYPFRVVGSVHDETGLPHAGASVFLGAHGFPLNRVARTDSEGRFAFTFRGRRPSFEAALAVTSGGRAPDDGGTGLFAVPLAAGTEALLELELESARQGIQAVLTMLSYVDATTGETSLLQEEVHSGRVESSFSFGGGSPWAPDAVRQGDESILLDPAPSLGCPRDLIRSSASEAVAMGDVLMEYGPVLTASNLLLDGQRLRLTSEPTEIEVFPEVVAGIEEQPDPELVTLRGTVRAATGEPVAGAAVEWRSHAGGAWERVLTGERGAFTLPNVAPGEVRLRVGAGALGRAAGRITAAVGQELAWNPILERGNEVTGRMLLGEHVLPETRIELWSVSPGFVWGERTEANEDGRFAFANVPPGRYELHVYCTGVVDPEGVFPARIVRSVTAGADLGDIVLEPRELVSHTLSVSVLDAEDEPLRGAHVRVWQTETGRGLFAESKDDAEHPGRFELGGLPPGRYRVEVDSLYGRRDLGEVWVDDDVDLGIETFEPPGLAVVAEGADAREANEQEDVHASVTVWSGHPDLRGRVHSREGVLGTPLEVRPGEHVVRVERPGRDPLQQLLEATPGTTSGFTLGLGADGRQVLRPGIETTMLFDLTVPAERDACASCHVGAR